MLWGTWWLVLKSCQCFRDIVKHRYMYSSSCVVPIKIHAKVSLSIPVVQAPVVFAEDGGKVFGMFAAYILNSKVINTQQE
jgi:hypothetical protein